MTRIAIPNEASPKDQRAAMTPVNVGKLTRAGSEVQVEAGLGDGCGYPDQQYREAGAGVTERPQSNVRIGRPGAAAEPADAHRGCAAEVGRCPHQLP